MAHPVHYRFHFLKNWKIISKTLKKRSYLRFIGRMTHLHFRHLQNSLKILDKSGIKLRKFYIKLTKILIDFPENWEKILIIWWNLVKNLLKIKRKFLKNVSWILCNTYLWKCRVKLVIYLQKFKDLNKFRRNFVHIKFRH